MQEFYVSLLALITPSSRGGVGLSDNQISFSTNTVNGWQGLSDGSRAAVAANENGPLKMESSLGHALYLHPIEQSGTYIYNSKDELITRSGAPLPNDGNLLANDNSAKTRGSKYNGTDWTTSFGVSAVLTNQNTSSSYFQNQKATPSGGSWLTNNPQYWPVDGSLSFYAYAPYCDDSHKMLSENVDKTIANAKTVHYVASATDIVNQPDLIIAKQESVTHSSTDAPTSVGLTFSHVLTAITFAVGSDMAPGTVKSIAIKGVKNEGDFDLAANTWKPSGNPVDITIKLGGGNGTKVTGKQDVALTTGDQTLMMIPQAFDNNSNAKVEIVFTKDGTDHTLSAPLHGTQWEAGSTIIYKVSTSSLLPTLTLNKVTFPTDWSSQYTRGVLKSDYVQGDKMGLYVVDQAGNVKEANVMLTYNGNTWSLPAGKNIRMNSMNNYFTYYPYQQSPQGMPAQNGTVQPNDLASANAFFKSLEDAWTLKTDQSNKTDLNAGDLQVAKAVVDNTGSGINITMAHAMGLADITLGPGIKCALKNDQAYTFGSWLVSDQFKTNIPYKLFCNHYIAIVKPTQKTVFSADADANALKYRWKKSLSFNPQVAQIQKQTAVMADETVHLYELQLGDVYYSTGTISHQTDVLEPECYTPIGIVGYIGKNKWTEYNTGSGHGGHALVMGLFNTGPYSSASDPNGTYYSFGPNGSYGTVYQNTSDVIVNSFDKDYGSGFINTDIFIKHGCNCAIQAKNYTTLKAPKDKSTGWFLPTAGQFYSFYSRIEGGISPTTWTMVSGLMNNSEKITAKIDAFLAKVGEGNYKPLFGSGVEGAFACSSELNANQACAFETDWAIGGPIGKAGFSSNGYYTGGSDKTIGLYSRPFLAF